MGEDSCEDPGEIPEGYGPIYFSVSPNACGGGFHPKYAPLLEENGGYILVKTGISVPIEISPGNCFSFTPGIGGLVTESEAMVIDGVSGTTVYITLFFVRGWVRGLTLEFYCDPHKGQYRLQPEDGGAFCNPPPPLPLARGITLIDGGRCVDETDIDCLSEDDVYSSDPDPDPGSGPGPGACIPAGQPSGGNPANCCSGTELSGTCL